MTNTSSGDLFDKPKTATDLLIDLDRYRMNKMGEDELKAKWGGQQWSTQGLRDWAAWQWKEGVK